LEEETFEPEEELISGDELDVSTGEYVEKESAKYSGLGTPNTNKKQYDSSRKKKRGRNKK